MRSNPTDRRARRRAALAATALVILVIAVLAVITVVVAAHVATTPPTATEHPTPAATASVSSVPGAQPRAEVALARRPMLALPDQAAQPHALTAQSAGPPIPLPPATQTVGRWIPTGFPRTPEGALAQLAVLDETALDAGDPAVYARGYHQLAQPGAPNPTTSGVGSMLTEFRAHAGFPATGPVKDLTVTYEVSAGQIKGVTSGGRYVVACVLGQLSIAIQGQIVDAGVGDCQALRWSSGGWRIASGVAAAGAPNAWPGSLDAVRAGYRTVMRP